MSVKQQNLHYLHQPSKRCKNIHLKINAQGQIIVSSPPRIKKEKIETFISQQQDWIQQQRQKIANLQKLIESDQHLLIFGKKYQKINQFDSQQSVGIFLTDNQQLLINYPKKFSQKIIKQEITNLLKKAARHYFKKKLPLLAEKMQVNYQTYTLRQQKTRWGSCSSSGSISLNWRLVHWQPPIIDYVLIHELAHLEHHNHSRKFWQFVAQYDPDYAEHRRFLQKHSLSF